MGVRTYLPTLLFLLISVLAITVHASVGDRLPEFRQCVRTCIQDVCSDPEQSELPFYLRLLFWTCPQNCDYTCQRSITASRIAEGLTVEQFHGKWPFFRVLGVQEPFSVIFSILNGYMHLRGLEILDQQLPKGYPMAKYYRGFAYIGIFCWFWSAVFHTRDFLLTERMDYFGAGANVLYGLYYAPIRLFRLYRPEHRHTLKLWSYLCIFCYIAHVYYLQFVSWDYTYNMAANVVVGVIGNVMWTTYSVRNYDKERKWWAAWPGMIVTWLVVAMSLELLDFPPVGDVIDAHSLWHAATIVPTLWWYHFLVRDARQDVEFGGEKGIPRVKQ